MQSNVNSYIETDFKDTEIGAIPADWKVTTLATICNCKGGFTFPPALQGKDLGDFPFYKVSDMNLPSNECVMTIANNYVSQDDLALLKAKPFRAGSVIFPKIGAAVHTNKKRILGTEALIDNNVMAVWVGNRGQCIDDYLFYYFMTVDLTDLANVGTLPSITNTRVNQQIIALPPLPEQRRIAAVLNAIQDEIAVQDDIIAEAREFKRSLMQRLFTYGAGAQPAETRETEIGEIPAHWEFVQFSDVLESLQYGTSKRCDYDSPGLPVLRIPNVIGGKVDATDLKFAEFSQGEQRSLELHDGDILFVRTNGNREYSGRSAVFHGVPAGALYASYLIRARFRPATLLPDFAQAYTETSMGKSFLSGRASETADGKFNINTGTINTVIAPKPPIWEQEEITEQLKVADTKIAVEEDRKTALQDFFKTMLHQLMTGQIRLRTDTAPLE